MLLNQLVRINEAGIVADAVDFGLMEQQDTNLKLCEGFVFNYDKDKPEESTIGVLEILRSSYDSRSQANVHLLIQQYGKGKSHFAVAIANYFSKPADSPEVEGILHQIENAAGKNSAIAEKLRLYKKRGRHLVLCLSGDHPGDIKKHFLKTLLKTLEAEGVANSVAQHICSEPLAYLQRLYANPQERERAEDYLESIGNPDGDLDAITQQLIKNNPAVIPTLKNLVKHLTGIVPDWNANVDIEEILKDLITTLCSGDNPQFQGILILFDELNFYLQNYAKDPIGSGGTALQNITKICENHKSKIALLSFTQIDPAMGIGISVGALEEHKKIATRLAPNKYQKVASSLELVLDNLILQETESPVWETFRSTWNNALLAETNDAYEKRITLYKQKGWSRDKFHNVLSIGCFPLHPLTSYLLCNLAFTQDRTALQFIKKNVKNFIQNQPLEIQGRLNWVRPIALIDTFLENFSQDSNYKKYKDAETALAGSDDPNELLVLKALFLFHASDRLTKTDREPHEEILATLTGLSELAVKAALDKLEKTRDIIFYKKEAKLYRFWGLEGNPRGIEQEIEEQIKDRNEEVSINRVVSFCRANLEQFLGSKTLVAKNFVDANKLIPDDWQFEYNVYTIDGFMRALSSDQTLRGTSERGIIAYVLGETQADLQDFRRRVDGLLQSSPIRDRIAVAIPSDETGELAYVLLKIQTLKNKDDAERRRLGAAYDELLKRWEEQVRTQAENLLKSCTYHCIGIEKLPPAEKLKPQRVISLLLEELYRFVPPVEGIPQMRSGHATGSTINGFVAKHLLGDSLSPRIFLKREYSHVVDTIFVNKWHLLKKTPSKYSVQEPTHEKVRAAWDLISEMTALGDQAERTIEIQTIWKRLSDAPYGYSAYTFTILLTGWLAYHRKEVSLKGMVAIPSGGKKSAPVSVEIKSLKDWVDTNADTNVTVLDKPSDFIQKWIITGNAKLIRRKKVSAPPQPQSAIDFAQAEQYLQAVEVYLESGDPDPAEIGAIGKARAQVQSGVNRINEWYQPVEIAESLDATASLEVLLELYPRLLSAPPALVLRDDVISVQPTTQQRNQQAQALQTIGEKIEQFVKTENDRSESLSTEEACSTYKLEVQNMLTQISKATSLPPALAETLQDSLQVADRKLLELREGAKVTNCLTQIQNRYKALGNAPTQQDYLTARVEIEALAQAAPAVKQNEDYEQILQSLKQKYNELTDQVEIWEEQSAGLDSPDQIHDLMGEINSRRYRITDTSSSQKIAKLLDHLKRELSRGQNTDEAIRAIRATLASANRKLERIRDLATTKLPEAFQSYQELMSMNLPGVNSAIALEEYQQELAGFKTKGRTALISEGFAKVYDLELKRLEDYSQMKLSLSERLEFIASHEDFADVKARLEQSLQDLDLKHAELQKRHQEQLRRSQDEQIIKTIRSKYKLPQANTIQFLEDGIREIQDYQADLYEPEPFASEIEQISQALQDRIATHKKSLQDLRDRLRGADSLKEVERIQTEYVRIEFTFKDSTEYASYQAFLQKIQELRSDLEKLQTLEALCQQKSYAIARCHETLSAIYDERCTFYDLTRFEQRLIELESILQNKIQTYIQELEGFEQKVERLATAKEAQKLHEELLRTADHYANSESSDRFETLSASLRALIDLLRIYETESIKTLEAYEAQAEKLNQWKDSIETFSPILKERFDAVYGATEKTKAQILRKQQSEVEKWFRNLETQATELVQLTDDIERGKLADRMLQKIQQHPDRAEALSAAHQESLKLIQRQCEAAVAKDCENEIIKLFERIPRPRRVSFYRELEALLSDPTEEFDG